MDLLIFYRRLLWCTGGNTKKKTRPYSICTYEEPAKEEQNISFRDSIECFAEFTSCFNKQKNMKCHKVFRVIACHSCSMLTLIFIFECSFCCCFVQHEPPNKPLVKYKSFVNGQSHQNHETIFARFFIASNDSVL